METEPNLLTKVIRVKVNSYIQKSNVISDEGTNVIFDEGTNRDL